MTCGESDVPDYALTVGLGSAGNLGGRSTCRFCDAPLDLSVVDLGMSPLCESFVSSDRLEHMEPFFPLHVRACTTCWLVQLPAYVGPGEIFREYAYYSSYSTSWVEHARRYAEMIQRRLGLGPGSFVVELASNDGYLLQHFRGSGASILGIDPAENVARAAEERGVSTLVEFFGRDTAERLVAEQRRAHLVIGNNVLAQVPDLNDFLAGVEVLLDPAGSATFEFPHLQRLLDGVQYDTIYHEHFSYFSLGTIAQIVGAHGLEVYDVEVLPTHGGSLRVYTQHAGGPHAVSDALGEILARELNGGINTPERYARFAEDVKESKHALLELLIGLRREGREVVGYGAPGKGNTLLNYCGIRTDLVDYIVDRNPHKHGLFTPGTHIPIHPVERLETDARQPDFILVLPWNLIDEIRDQLAFVGDWGGKLVVPIPRATVLEPGRPQAVRVAGSVR